MAGKSPRTRVKYIASAVQEHVMTGAAEAARPTTKMKMKHPVVIAKAELVAPMKEKDDAGPGSSSSSPAVYTWIARKPSGV